MKNTRLIQFKPGTLDMIKLDQYKVQLKRLCDNNIPLKMRNAAGELISFLESIKAQENEVIDKLLAVAPAPPCTPYLPLPIEDIITAKNQTGELTEQQAADLKEYIRSIWYNQSRESEENLQYLNTEFPYEMGIVMEEFANKAAQ